MKNSMKMTTMALMATGTVMCMAYEAEASSMEKMIVAGTTSTLNIRDIQDQTKILEKLPAGTTVYKIKNMPNQKGWVYVQTPSGKKGVCSGLYLKSAKGQTQSVAEKNTLYTNAKVNIRSGPGTAYRVMKTVPKGTPVEKISQQGSWVKIKLDGIIRYCHVDYLTTNPNSTNVSSNKVNSYKEETYYVNTSSLNVRYSPNTGSKVYKKLAKGDAVKVVVENRNDGWKKININGKAYYVSGSYLTKNKVSSLTSSSSNTTTNNNVSKTYSYVGVTPTKFSASASVKNMKIAFNKMNGTVVKPGQTFSYLSAIGPVTKANGYVESGTIVNGKPSTGVGGGICQGSTTLFNALIETGIKPVERRNHSLPSKYVSKGLDAMVAGSLDFKFKNTTPYPITIYSTVEGGYAKVTFKSNGDLTGGHTFRPRVVISSDGLKATTYLQKFKEGKFVSEQIIARSTYKQR